MAEKSLLSYIQQHSFRDEVTLQKGQSVKRSSRIYKLDPILQNGTLRVGGRLSKLAMPEETKHPAILPILHTLQTKYWIIKANSSARKINCDCVLSRWRHGTAMKQKMADLPLICVTPDMPPFTHTGLNYFHPIEIKSGRSKGMGPCLPALSVEPYTWKWTTP